MRMGTRSLLFGAHQFLIHPVSVAAAWIKLYGFPWKWQYWLAFLVHDWGYWGRRNIDGFDGKWHPTLGGRIMGRLAGSEWEDFTFFHSKYIADAFMQLPSTLCVADKLAFSLEPWWLIGFRMWLSGEYIEYWDKCSRENIQTSQADNLTRVEEYRRIAFGYERKPNNPSPDSGPNLGN